MFFPTGQQQFNMAVARWMLVWGLKNKYIHTYIKILQHKIINTQLSIIVSTDLNSQYGQEFLHKVCVLQE